MIALCSPFTAFRSPLSTHCSPLTALPSMPPHIKIQKGSLQASSTLDPEIMELAKLGHSADSCHSTFLLAGGKIIVLTPTIYSNYTWPAWLCSWSTCESILFFQTKTSASNQVGSIFPLASHHQSFSRSGEAHCKRLRWPSQAISSTPLCPLSFPCLSIIREPK